MSVRVHNGRVYLEGNCPVEDAEILLQALQESLYPVEIGRAERLHTAVVQVLLAAKPEIVGEPANTFLRFQVMPILAGRNG